MQKNMVRKGIVFGIMVLFVGMSIVPSTGNIVKEHDMSFVEDLTNTIAENKLNNMDGGARSIVWDVRVNFTETGGASDWVIFGEAPDASDGVDTYDALDPGGPPTPPYINAYITTTFPYPYTILMQEIKHYSANNNFKEWNLTIYWTGGPTQVTISWNTSEFVGCEYDSVVLYDNVSNCNVSDMLVNNSYNFTYTPSWPYPNFKIICTANQPPVVGDIPDQTIEEGASFTAINLDDYVDDPDNDDDELIWTYLGNTELTVTIVDRVATITVPSPEWNGAETITFNATDPGGKGDEDAAAFTVNPFNDLPEITNVTITTSDPLDTVIGWENFTCTVTDDTEVDTVQLNLIYPDLHTEYFTMNKDGDNYYYNTTLTAYGGHYTPGYTYHIYANDTYGRTNTSTPEEFDLPMNQDVDMDGKVHFMDLIAVSLAYNDEGPDGWVREDVDNGGKVHFMDLIAISMAYNEEW